MADRTIHIGACVFGSRFVVSIEPRTVDMPSREFRAAEQARVHATAMGETHGWSIIDATEDDR